MNHSSKKLAASPTYEKIAARIAKIGEQALEDTTSFRSKCNTLETLRKVVDTILRTSGGAMGIEIYEYMNRDRNADDSMLRILESMTSHERDELLTVKNDGGLRIESMDNLDTFRLTKCVFFGDHQGEAPFPGIGEVLDLVYGQVENQRVEDGVEVKEESAGE